MIAEAFRTGGVWMYLILALGLVSNPVALLTMAVTLFAKPSHRKALIVVGLVSLAAAVLTVGIGLLGYFTGISEVHQALEKATPENRERLLAYGTEIAAYPAQFSLIMATLPFLAGLSALLRQASLR